jgi:hypothetical protein
MKHCPRQHFLYSISGALFLATYNLSGELLLNVCELWCTNNKLAMAIERIMVIGVMESLIVRDELELTNLRTGSYVSP